MTSGRGGSLLLLAPAVLFLGVFFLAPVLSFIVQGFLTREGAPTFDHVARMWAAGTYLRVLWVSIEISAWVTLFSILVGYPVAYVLATADKRSRGYWALFVLLPFWSSFLVRTFAWIVILGRNGPINATLWANGFDRLELLYSPFAVVLGMTNVLVPFAILTMVGVMEAIDPQLKRAAGTLGARPVQAFFRVYLPLSMPGVTAAALLVFITALGFFMAPALLGSARETMITQLIIQQVIELTNWPFAAILCLLLLAAALVIFWVYDRIVGLSALAGEARAGAGRLSGLATRVFGGIGDTLARIANGLGLGGRIGGTAGSTRFVAVLVLVFLSAPLLFLVPVSVTTQSFVSWPPTGFTFRWYQEAFTSPLWTGAAARSFVVALLTALACFVVAVPAAFAVIRLSGRSAALVFALLVSPLMMPRLVIAVALFWVYARFGMVGTVAGLVIGHAVIALPFFFIAVIAILKTYDRRLDLAAASLGASPWQTARRVTLPLIGTGLVAAALFAFVTSLDELNVALFASGGLQSTLPKLLWDEATLRFSPLIAAVSTLVLLVMSAFVLIASRLAARAPE